MTTDPTPTPRPDGETEWVHKCGAIFAGNPSHCPSCGEPIRPRPDGETRPNYEHVDGIPLVEPGGWCGACGTRWSANDAPCPTCTDAAEARGRDAARAEVASVTENLAAAHTQIDQLRTVVEILTADCPDGEEEHAAEKALMAAWPDLADDRVHVEQLVRVVLYAAWQVNHTRRKSRLDVETPQ